jgi:hypothetical protein
VHATNDKSRSRLNERIESGSKTSVRTPLNELDGLTRSSEQREEGKQDEATGDRDLAPFTGRNIVLFGLRRLIRARFESQVWPVECYQKVNPS